MEIDEVVPYGFIYKYKVHIHTLSYEKARNIHVDIIIIVC